jgi:hypothetical protein
MLRIGEKEALPARDVRVVRGGMLDMMAVKYTPLMVQTGGLAVKRLGGWGSSGGLGGPRCIVGHGAYLKCWFCVVGTYGHMPIWAWAVRAYGHTRAAGHIWAGWMGWAWFHVVIRPPP